MSQVHDESRIGKPGRWAGRGTIDGSDCVPQQLRGSVPRAECLIGDEVDFGPQKLDRSTACGLQLLCGGRILRIPISVERCCGHALASPGENSFKTFYKFYRVISAGTTGKIVQNVLQGGYQDVNCFGTGIYELSTFFRATFC